ncbi:hypothetical protein BN13_2100002 [Nostocoides jenkinsii Ben 74]|uniref:Uncharacterized protein n=1 Tax=Nostocoides jenkinsii Ben 74 TaxID=1193518 RepID=A0A077M8B6_9MICO|nr:hypothetical protein BN13_2100002 [Tetrasphaera jenkinsii Ben 74]
MWLLRNQMLLLEMGVWDGLLPVFWTLWQH